MTGLDFSFVGDNHLVGEKMAKNGRKFWFTVSIKELIFFLLYNEGKKGSLGFNLFCKSDTGLSMFEIKLFMKVSIK
jgi:hypothetical protein